MEQDRKDKIRELTLMLMFLTSWEESVNLALRAKKKSDLASFPVRRYCWKGYNFDALNELTAQGMIDAGGRSKQAVFTAEGEAAARELLKQYGIEPQNDGARDSAASGT